MAALNAIEGMRSAGGYVNACISIDLSSIDPSWIGWPPGQMDCGIADISALTRVPAVAHPVAISAMSALSYMTDFYYRIHIIPAVIDVGNLVTSQTRAIAVWNAWPDQSRTLIDIEATNAEGIDVSGADVPAVFAPLQVRTWQINVSTSGAAVIDAALSWLFAGLDPIQVAITGNRLTAWTMAPDWSNGIVETLLWLTDVQTAANGAQLRVPLRQAPRRQWEFGVLLGAAERQRMETTLYDWRGRVWALPVWTDQTMLTSLLAAGATGIALDTTAFDFAVGGLAMLYRDVAHYELVEVAGISASAITLARPTINAWAVGTRVYPCRTARITDTPTLTRHSADVLSSSLRFESMEPCDYPATAPSASYLGYPVLEDRPDETGDLTAKFDRHLDIADGDIGLVDVVDLDGLPWASQSHVFWHWGRSARGRLRELLYWLAGRAQAVWVPSFVDDLTLAATILGAGTTLTVVSSGQVLYGLRPGRRHLRIELFDGRVIYAGARAAVPVDDATEALALDAPPGFDITPAMVRQINWMMLATLADDTVELQHGADAYADNAGLATCTVSWAATPADEPEVQ